MKIGIASLRLFLALTLTVSCNNATSFGGKDQQYQRTKRGLPPNQSDDSTSPKPIDLGSAKKNPGELEPPDSIEDTETASKSPTKIEQDFPVTLVEDGEVSFEFRRDWLEQTIKLENRYEPRKQLFNQNDRPSYSKAYQQGNAGQSVAEEFTQNAMGILDLIVVIDNSNSMTEEQANLSTKLAPLLQYVQESDWKINVVTTDPSKGCTRGGVINKNDANAASAFQSAVSAGIGGSSNERGILQAVNALSCNQITGFPRTKSSIAVLIVADEDNCSANGADCGSDPWNTPTYLTNYLQNPLGRTLGSDTRVYGIFWHPDTPKANCSTGANKAVQYAQAVSATNGVYGTICDADYSATLRQISKDMATILKSEFNLSMDPDANSLVVKVNDVQVNSGWKLTGRTLTFTDLPPASAKIKVNYTTGARPIQTRFALDQTPEPSTLVVKINGVIADPNSYSIDNNTNELVFATPPSEKATITANFRGNVALLTEFDLVAGIRPGSIAVKINDIATTDYTVIANAKLKFNTPPADAAKIDVAYEILSATILDYPVALMGSMIEDLSIVDKKTGEPVVASYANGVVSIDASEHTEGRELILRYKNETSKIKTVELPHLPEPDSVVLERAPEACSESYTVQESTVTFECNEDAEGTILVSYRYAEEPRISFTVEGVPNPESGVWEVSIAGVVTKAYERKGSTITLTDMPDEDAVVTIIWKVE